MELGEPEPTPSRGRGALIALGALLALSVIGNIVLAARGPTIVERVVEAPAPPAPVCPEPPVCEVCEVCPELPPPVEGTATGTGDRPRPPRIDEGAAAEGEAHLAHAESEGERDPVQVAAQRRVADGVDRIVTSRSPTAALRFIQRNLPSFASMDCAFRDPAAAEHVRMRLRELNELARPDDRLTEAELTRYERDLRCPRE